MEVLGAVASSIALVQALAAGKHVVSIIREAPDIQNDFNYMMKELTLIKSMAKAISGMPPSAYEHDLIYAAAEDLSEVTQELELLLRSCAHEVDTKDSKVFKTRKRKWLLEKGTVTKLQQRMANAKNTLHFAITTSRATNDAQFQAYARHMLMNLCAMHTVHNSTSDGSSHNMSKSDRLADSSEASVLGAIDVNNHDGKTQVTESISTQSLTHIRGTSSSTSCQCSCHFSKRQYQNSGWVRSLFGSWLVRCENRPQECSNPDCQCISSSTLKLEYQVPRWLFLRSFAIVASYNNIGGLRGSLRPFKLLEMDTPLWNRQKGPRQVYRKTVVEYGVYPCDANTIGIGLIEYAVADQRYTALETLLDLWGNLLPELELPRRIADHVNDLLSWESDNLGDHEIYLLQKLVRLIGHQSRETTKIHIAIRRREGLQEALQEQPWAINTIDYTGHCPLTLATYTDQIDCMEMLVSAGADVNQLTSQGRSALMFASHRGNSKFVRLLLNTKCKVDWADIYGSTALHHASRSQCVESICLLLAAGASPCQNVYGGTPLHEVAMSLTNKRGDARRAIELLVLAGADLEAQDIRGYTPIMATFYGNNTSVMRSFLDLGCSPTLTNSKNQNILHIAAMLASLEMLEYLGSLGLHDINPYQRDSYGNTPKDWILKSYDQKVIGGRTPSTFELCAFLNVCQSIEDRSLHHNIGDIEQVMAGLRNGDAATAREHLNSLLTKEGLKREDLACWYRGVDKRIQNLEWDLATEDLSDYLTELKEDIGTPVYEIPSRYGCTFLDSKIWEVTTWSSEALELETSE